MAFKVKPFVEVIAMTKEKLDEALAPIRSRSAKAKADLACAKLEEKLITLEREIHEACASKDIDFDAIITKMDSYDLTERKVKQIKNLVRDLFPGREAA